MLKSLCNKVGFSEVNIEETHAELCFLNKVYLNKENLFVALNQYKNVCKLDVTRKLAVVFKFSGQDLYKNMDTIKKFVLLFQ